MEPAILHTVWGGRNPERKLPTTQVRFIKIGFLCRKNGCLLFYEGSEEEEEDLKSRAVYCGSKISHQDEVRTLNSATSTVG